MASRSLRSVLLLSSLLASASGIGCLLGETTLAEDDAAESDIVATSPAVTAALSSTVLLPGCTATKVGAKQLLTAARCIGKEGAIAAGKTVAIKVNRAPAAGTTTAAAKAETIFTTELYPSIDKTCAGCHREGLQNAPKVFGADAPATYANFKTRGYHEATSKYRTKGAHKGPALTEDQLKIVDKWQAAEAEAANPALTSVDVKIAKVTVHETFATTCKDERCAFGAVRGSEANDVAVIELDEELSGITELPVDLDAIADADPVTTIGSGCAGFDQAATKRTLFLTNATPSQTAEHEGSAYKEAPPLTKGLGKAYVLTAGPGWRSDEQALCPIDIGAPIFRGDKAVIGGVTSNFTVWTGKQVPVTVHHTRVDKDSGIGPWLANLGVKTIKSCSETTAGCTKNPYDGGVPTPGGGGAGTGSTSPSDAGGDVLLRPDTGKPDAGKEEPETDEPAGADDGPFTGEENPEPTPSTDAGAKKKKKKPAQSCSAAPGDAPPAGVAGLGLALAATVLFGRRRRTSASR